MHSDLYFVNILRTLQWDKSGQKLQTTAERIGCEDRKDDENNPLMKFKTNWGTCQSKVNFFLKKKEFDVKFLHVKSRTITIKQKYSSLIMGQINC